MALEHQTKWPQVTGTAPFRPSDEHLDLPLRSTDFSTLMYPVVKAALAVRDGKDGATEELTQAVDEFRRVGGARLVVGR